MQGTFKLRDYIGVALHCRYEGQIMLDTYQLIRNNQKNGPLSLYPFSIINSPQFVNISLALDATKSKTKSIHIFSSAGKKLIIFL
jgi:hypothetical protein